MAAAVSRTPTLGFKAYNPVLITRVKGLIVRPYGTSETYKTGLIKSLLSVRAKRTAISITWRTPTHSCCFTTTSPCAAYHNTTTSTGVESGHTGVLHYNQAVPTLNQTLAAHQHRTTEVISPKRPYSITGYRTIDFKSSAILGSSKHMLHRFTYNSSTSSHLIRSISTTSGNNTDNMDKERNNQTEDKPKSKALHLDQSNIQEAMSKYDTLLLDCDGVLWANDHFTNFSGIPESIHKLRTTLGKKLYFVTNNSLHARQAYLEKFRNFAGFEADLEDVFGVAYAAALYLKNVAKVRGKCYLVGSIGMARELDSVGIPYSGLGADDTPTSIHPDDLMAIELDPEVEAVVVGFDEHFNYIKMFKAASYLANPKCHYIATNDLERALQLSPTQRQPLTGALVTAISTATSREPLVIGKPHAHLLECIQSKVKDIDLSRTLMVGDSMKTDIGFAHTIGVDSLLVLTGSTNMDTLRKYENNGETVPTYYMESFSHFGQFL